MMEREIEGIVLSTSEYREHDGLLTILTEEDKKIRFVARGIQKITSKNAGALLIGAQSLFLLQMRERGDLHTLKHAKIKQYRRRISMSLLKQAMVSFYCEMMLKNDDIAGGYALLKSALDDLDKNDDCFTAACVFVNQLCLAQGIAPWVDGCISCGRNDHITTLSLRQGGFVCTDCIDRLREVPWTRKQLQRFRYLCHAKMNQLDELRAYDQYGLEDLKQIFAFFNEYSGVNIKGFSFLQQVAEMEEKRSKRRDVKDMNSTKTIF